MLFYNYSRETFEYIGEPEEAKLDPVGKQPMVPAFATIVAPPTTGTNEVAVFNINTNSWSIVSDFRGTVYYNSFGKKFIIENLGDTVPDDCTTTPPPEKIDFYTLNGKDWVTKPIQDIRDMKITMAYGSAASVINQSLWMYSDGERETWSKMNDECIEYKNSGVIGSLMLKKISTSPIYDTADKLADMTISQYQLFIDGKFSVEAQRDHHKININNMNDANALIEYDVSISL